MGSNPNGAAETQYGLSQPLRYFLIAVGEAVASLNTIVVGLDAIEKGHEKPETLNISWNPRDRIVAARKTRRFAIEAVLVRVAEALNEYVTAIAHLPCLEAVRQSWTSNTSRAEKLADVAARLPGPDRCLVAGAVLLIHWRNRVVHPASRASLTPQQEKDLRTAAQRIERDFAGLSIDRLLSDFDAGRPTLKDITSLIAMSIRTARGIDKIVGPAALEDVEAMLRHYGLSDRIEVIKAQTTPAKRQASVLRFLKSTAPGLAEAYDRLHCAHEGCGH